MKLEQWRQAQGISYRELGDLVGVSYETARQHCQPVGHPAFCMPRRLTMQRYVLATGGAVQPADFYTAPAALADRDTAS